MVANFNNLLPNSDLVAKCNQREQNFDSRRAIRYQKYLVADYFVFATKVGNKMSTPFNHQNLVTESLFSATKFFFVSKGLVS